MCNGVQKRVNFVGHFVVVLGLLFLYVPHVVKAFVEVIETLSFVLSRSSDIAAIPLLIWEMVCFLKSFASRESALSLC